MALTRNHITLFVFAVVAAVLTAVAATGAIMPGELALSRWLQDTPGGFSIEPVADLVALKPAQGTAAVVFAVIALRAGRPSLALSAVLVFVLLSLNPMMKELIGRARPTPDDLAIREPAHALGFPSGHASSAVLLYGYVIVAAWRSLRGPGGLAVTAIVAPLVLLIGWDRVWDGAHWPSDVLGGLSVGALLLAFALWAPAAAERAFLRLLHARRVERRQMVGQAGG